MYPVFARFLEFIAEHTGKLERYMDEVKPNMSLRLLASKNPVLLGVVIRVDSEMRSIVADVPLVVQEWIVDLVHGFIHNCHKLIHIIIDDHEDSDDTLIPQDIRIPGLDSAFGAIREALACVWEMLCAKGLQFLPIQRNLPLKKINVCASSWNSAHMWALRVSQ